MVNTSGNISTIAGTGTFGYTGDGAAATAATLYRPGGVAVDAAGNIYIADTRNNAIREITGGTINTIAGNGTPGYSGDGAAATSALVSRPSAVAISGTTLYIADAGNNVVRAVNSTGVISTFAGNGTAGYAGDGGPATAANLSAVNGVAADASGNIYIADASNTVREVSTTGTINTIAGTGLTAGYSGDGGLATLAKLNGPVGVAFDAASNIYIADANNNIIRRIGAATTGITIASSTGDTVCLGTNQHFTATVYAFATPHYQWEVNATVAGTDSAGFTDATLAAGDVITCTLIDGSGNPVAVSGPLTVRTVPVAGTVTGLSAPLCAGVVLPLRDSPTVAGGFWGITNSTVATITTTPPFRITAVSAGTDSVFYYRSNVCGSDTAWAVITVTANPISPIVGPATVCAGSSVTFTDATTGDGWQIRPPFAGTIDPATGVFTAGNAPVTQTVYVIYGTPTCYVRDSIVVDTLPMVPPIAGPTTVNMGGTITLTDPATGGTWSSSDVTLATVGAATGVVTGVAYGTVTITYSITNTNGCTGIATYDVNVDYPAGVSNVANNSSFSVYPNPASGNVMVQWTSAMTGNGTLTVADVTGRTVLNSSIDLGAAAKHANVNIGTLKAGIYMLHISSASGTYTSKLVVE